MSVEQYSLVAHDWLNLEFIINDLASRVIGQELSPGSSPTFAGVTITGLTETRVLFAGAGGIISDDAGLVYASATNILTAGTFNATNEDDIVQVDGNCLLATRASVESNLLLGVGAGANLDSSGGGNDATKNLFIGKNAGKGGTPNIGKENVALGTDALSNVTSGVQNFALGTNALLNTTTGGSNIAIGTSALQTNNSFGNVAIGTTAMILCAASFNNVAIGFNSGNGTAGQSYNSNVMLGYRTGYTLTNGSENVIIGFETGRNITTGDSNVFIGYKSGRNQTINNDLLIIDNQDRGSAAAEITDCLIYGIFSATPASQSLRFNVGTTTWHNATHTDADGGRSSIFNFKGQQSGGEETTLARIEVGHDGSADDEKGYLDLLINDGDDGDSPTHMLRANSVGIGIGITSLTRKFTVVENDSDAIFIRDNNSANASTLGFGVNTTTGFAFIQSRKDGSGTDLPLTFWTESSKVIEIGTDQITKIGDGGTTDYTEIEADGTIKFNGAAAINGLRLGVTTQTNTDYSALATDDFILVSTGATTRTITLPASPPEGKVYHIKKIDPGVGLVTIDGNGNNIDDDATPDITAQYESFSMVFGNSEWNIF